METALALHPEAFVLHLFFASLRVGAALAMLPSLGGQMIPVRVRVGLAGAIGLMVMQSGHAPPPADLLGLPGMAQIAGELLIGAVAALSISVAFAVAAVAGDWMAQSMGLGFATVVDPTAPASPVLSAMLTLFMWSLFLGSGGHLLFIRMVFESYSAMPSAGALFEPWRLKAIAGWGSFAIGSGIIAAMPMGVGMLLVNMAVAVAARSAPQFNLISIGFPLMLLMGLAALPLALAGLADSLPNALSGMQTRLAEVLLG